MKITILGSGTSTGVPEIGCTCQVCTSADPRDKRLRTSALFETETECILADCGPDFRAQMLRCGFRKIDGVLITHEHYDHVGGIDDLRPFCRFGEVPLYAEDYTAERLKNRIPYCFGENKYLGVPQIVLEEIVPDRPFHINRAEIVPIRVMHGALPILGYRINNVAYVTDMKTMPEEELSSLQGLDCLIVNALRHEPHWTHQTLDEALAFAGRTGAKETYFIHMSHHVGLHAEVEKKLPPHCHLAYDGLEIFTP